MIFYEFAITIFSNNFFKWFSLNLFITISSRSTQSPEFKTCNPKISTDKITDNILILNCACLCSRWRCCMTVLTGHIYIWFSIKAILPYVAMYILHDGFRTLSFFKCKLGVFATNGQESCQGYYFSYYMLVCSGHLHLLDFELKISFINQICPFCFCNTNTVWFLIKASSSFQCCYCNIGKSVKLCKFAGSKT